jgi:Mg2+-importing ATPase
MFKNFTRQLFAQLAASFTASFSTTRSATRCPQSGERADPGLLGKQCLDVAAMDENEIWRAFSHPEGLNAGEVAQKIAQYGENQIPAQKPSPWWVHLWSCYRNPFNLLLTVLGIVSYSTEDLPPRLSP